MEAMSAEKEKNPGRVRLALMGVFGLAVVGGICFVRSGEEPIVFSFVDRNTGKALTNVIATVHRQWTSIPLKKVPLVDWSQVRSETFHCTSGSIKISPPRDGHWDFEVWFNAPGYLAAAFNRKDGDLINYTYEPCSDWTESTNLVKIALLPERERSVLQGAVPAPAPTPTR
jgi:hypothetical protein